MVGVTADADGMAELVERAGAVLDGNWTGRATKPAPRLYPHQWSWDSAFIAIGNRHRNWQRAVTELTTLFDAQWDNGMVPHIVFGPDDPGYFPSAAHWASHLSPHCPPDVASSGICQPPVHATAVRAVHGARPDDPASRELVGSLVPKLAAWHDYLHRERAVDGDLIEIWHPWESGRDNNPEWDGPMRNVVFDAAALPTYRRVDTTHADEDDRPSDAEYDVYLYLVEQLKRVRFDPADPTAQPFRVRDVLCNALLARADDDLAALCDLVDIDGSTYRQRSAALLQAIDDQLWSPATGLYHSMDGDGSLLPTRTSGAFLPLVAGRLAEDRVESLLDVLRRDFLVTVGEDAAVPLTIPTDEDGFDPGRYWRGPAWVNMTWLVAEGLDIQGEPDLADQLRRGVATLCADVGFHEYFDPHRSTGHGSDDFSWSAALIVDLVLRDERALLAGD